MVYFNAHGLDRVIGSKWFDEFELATVLEPLLLRPTSIGQAALFQSLKIFFDDRR